MAQNKASARSVLRSSLANKRVADNLLTALGSHYAAAMIIATNVSQTIDFGALKIGDIVLHIPAVAGNSNFRSIAVVGTLGAAAVVGDLYMVMRAQNLDVDQGSSSLYP